MARIIISTTGHQHLVIRREGKNYYKCIRAVGSFPNSKIIEGKVTCKNCDRGLRNTNNIYMSAKQNGKKVKVLFHSRK